MSEDNYVQLASLWPSNAPKKHRRQHSICVILKDLRPFDRLNAPGDLEAALAVVQDHTRRNRGGLWAGEDDAILIPIGKNGDQFHVMERIGSEGVNIIVLSYDSINICF